MISDRAEPQKRAERSELVRLNPFIPVEVRDALRLAAAQHQMDMSDLVTDILRAALADQLAELEKRRAGKPPAGGKYRPRNSP